MAPAFGIRKLTAADIPAVRDFWASIDGVGLNECDEPAALERYLLRNPGLSLVVRDDAGEVAGAVLCGHDGRRGYLNHLAVAPEYRHRGLGRRLVARCLNDLAALGILRCNIFLYVDNEPGRRFWQCCRWAPRTDLQTWQRLTTQAPDEQCDERDDPGL